MRRVVWILVVAAHAKIVATQETLPPSPLPTPLPSPLPTVMPSYSFSSTHPTPLPTPLPSPLTPNPTPLPTPSPTQLPTPTPTSLVSWEYVYNEDDVYRRRAEARHENGFVEVEGLFYLLGGRGYKPVNIFADNDWTKGKHSRNVHHFQPVAVDGQVFIVCAFTGTWPNETPLEYVVVYDVRDGNFETGHTIPESRRRGAAGTVVYDDVIYVVGGITNGHVDGTVAWFDEYHRATGDWVVLEDAPHSRDHGQAATIENKLYIAGGRLSGTDMADNTELLSSVDVYDFLSSQWITLDKPLPTPRAAAAVVVWRGVLVVIGGESSDQNTAHDEVEFYDPATNHWGALPSLIRGRHGTSAFVYLDSIYICAGSGNRGGAPELSSIEIFTTT